MINEKYVTDNIQRLSIDINFHHTQSPIVSLHSLVQSQKSPRHMLATTLLTLLIMTSLYTLTTKGQCNRYVNIRVNDDGEYAGFSSTGMFTSDRTQILSVVVDKCMPNYSDYSPAMQFHLGSADQGYISANTRTRDSSYSECGFDLNQTKVDECDGDDCDQTKQMIEYLQTGNYLNQCVSMEANVSVSSVVYGYYENKCDYITKPPLLFKLECECDDTYKLSMYLNGTCLFEASLFANSSFVDVDDISCQITECGLNNDASNYQIDYYLTEYHECSNECTDNSILPTIMPSMQEMNTTAAGNANSIMIGHSIYGMMVATLCVSLIFN